MKKRSIIACLLTLVMLLGMTGCADQPANNQQNGPTLPDNSTTDNSNTTQPSAFPADRAISIVSYNDAGGGADTAARIVTANMQTVIGQRVDVVNMSGGGGLEAMEYILNQPHDGYTLLLGDITFINQYLTSDVPYTLDDFVPVAKVGKSAPVFFVRSDSPFQSVEDVIEACKANPGSISIAHGRVNSGPHVTLKSLENLAGFESSNVATNGGSEALSFVLGGHVDMGISIPSTISAGVESGDLRPLAVSDTKRWDGFLADVPTLLELGYDVNLSGGFTVYAPSDTPAENLKLLSESFIAAMESDGAAGMAKAAKVTMAPELTMDDVASEYASVIQTMTNYYTLTGELLEP